MRTFYIISRFCKCHIEEVLLKIWESTWSKYFKYLVCLCLFLLPYLSIYPFITHTHTHTHTHNHNTTPHTHLHPHNNKTRHAHTPTHTRLCVTGCPSAQKGLDLGSLSPS